MADFYKWDPAFLSVDVKEMDGEHIILIEKMNALHAAYTAKAPLDQLKHLVQDFASYTVKHFSDEEAYMDKIKFEGAATHKIIHKQLLAEVTKHVEEFQKTGALTEKFFSFLSVWLTSHIRGIDRKYSPHK